MKNSNRYHHLATFVLIFWLTNCEIRETVAQEPAFDITPSDTEVNVGETGYLQCVIRNAENLKCFWKKNDMAVDIKERYSYTNAPGPNIPTNGECSLKIESSKLNDTGMWSCGLEGTSSKGGITTEDDKKYTVYQIPDDPVIVRDNISLKNGSKFYIPDSNLQPKVECISKNGYPEATLQWSLSTEGSNEYLTGTQTLLNTTTNQHESLITTTLILNDSLSKTWEGSRLTCSVQHPGYKSSPPPSVNVILTLPNHYGRSMWKVEPMVVISIGMIGWLLR